MALATFLLQLVLLGWVMTRDPVASTVWTEVVAGPLYVMFAGALGAAMTRLISHPSTPLFTVLVLIVLMTVFPYQPYQWGREISVAWLSPLAWPQDIIPYELTFRPAGLHLGYLAALVVIAGALASTGRRVVPWAVLVAAVSSATVFGLAQLGPVAQSRQAEAIGLLVGKDAHLTCETHGAINYCAMPGYEGWIDVWVEATQPMAEVGPPERVEGMEIRQYPVHITFILDGEDYNNWWWIGPAYDDLMQRPNVVPVGSMWWDYGGSLLARDVAGKIMGCDPACDGEAQQVVYLWMASQHPEIRSIVQETMSLRSDGASVAECMVTDLWARPDAQTLIHTNWDTLTAAGTTYQEAGAVLGVAVPTGEDEYGYLGSGCP